MSSAWLLPEHLADVLPSEAKRIEGLRRALTDEAQAYGYELVMPPLLEHLDSLLSGTGRALGLQTFKLVDQLSGRTLGLRADTTPQVARIDAHLLNRHGVARLCYCGPVVHTRPAGPWASREPLQFGAELYGHAGLEADLEVLELALDGLRQVGVRDAVLDLGDARIANALLQALGVDAARRAAIQTALAAKDSVALEDALQAELTGSDAGRVAAARALTRLPRLYGSVEVLERAAAELPPHALITQALDDLHWIVRHAKATHPDVRIGMDLADLGGQDYYSGIRFSVMGAAASQVLASGGRYDDVGRVFGRERPAVGFSLDLKSLSQALQSSGPAPAPRPAIRAPWAEDAGLRAAVRALRSQGETVVCILPGHEHEAQEFACDRELVLVAGHWVLQAL
ncbi:MAG: ATP phosphoribosyltransferase regulatory subunit [Betaproteobacteria bacterium]|nr:ATP phosphoribosyltransferase regulatory subunit [Betaproteobacteria bacterium]NBU49725.1 ATP phosphoribosyltransferase regulatory subunit [Betaproteobacteria bacterium]